MSDEVESWMGLSVGWVGECRMGFLSVGWVGECWMVRVSDGLVIPR